MSRLVPEWIGATDNTPVPNHVRVRIFDRGNGLCKICTRKIRPGDRWICDHTKALVNGGENRETNLQVICDWCDKKVKTPADVAEKSDVYESRKRHLGLGKSRSAFRGWRKMNGEVKWAKW
jgi:hypothetical protein